MTLTNTGNALLLFTRFPEPGKVKSRLIGKLGAEGAAHLHSLMTRHILDRISPTLLQQGIRPCIFYSGATKAQMHQWLGNDFVFYSQQGNTLGERMRHAFNRILDEGAERILLIGSDCPDIDPTILQSGFAALAMHELVLGPAYDGGYYLMGLQKKSRKKAPTCLFKTIRWGTDSVLQQTRQLAEENGISCAMLSQLHDIDRPKDLVYFDYNTNA